MNFVFMVLPLLNQSGHGSSTENATQIGGAIGGTIGGLFGLIYPVLLLIFMTRPKVKAAFVTTEYQPTMSVQ
jgi:tetrahydromethanopterin S-methyltransferase subunit G